MTTYNFIIRCEFRGGGRLVTSFGCNLRASAKCKKYSACPKKNDFLSTLVRVQGPKHL